LLRFEKRMFPKKNRAPPEVFAPTQTSLSKALVPFQSL